MIATFTQGVDEPLCEAWEWFNSLFKQCLAHGLDDGGQINTFLVGLRPQTKLMLNASTRRKIMYKTPDEAKEIIENNTSNDYEVLHDRILTPTQNGGVLELNSHDAILAQNKLLT